jgi:SAM-dependent methyltransferase
LTGVFHVGDNAYDDFMGRYSVRLAPPFADFVAVGEGDRVLDVGAGTGALAAELLRRGADVAAAEPSREFTDALRTRFPSLEVHEAPAEQLPFEDDVFDVALAQLVVAFMADAPAAMRELARVARRVAICAAIGRTARAIGGGSQPDATRYRTSAELVALLEGAELQDVETAELDVTAPYTGYDDFWHALSGQVGPAGAWLKSLDDDRRAAAHDELFRQLGSPSAAFELSGRAYAAKATRA